MFPKLFTIPAFELLGRELGPVTIHTYGALLALAFVAGLWIVSRQARSAGLESGKITDLAIYLLIAGMLGAKALLLAVDWHYFTGSGRELLSLVQSGGVFYGGLIAAIPVAWWYARKHGLEAWRTVDVLAPGVVLGQAIGRLGCLSAGCCYGKPTDVAWSVTFRDLYSTRTVGTPIDTPLHPTQVYESLACFLILAALLWIAPRKRFHGQVAVTYVVLYATVRFAIEFFRGDAVRGTVLGGHLSTSQGIAILMVAAALAVLPYLLKKQRLEPAPA